MKIEGNLRKVVAGLGVLIFILGIHFSLNRYSYQFQNYHDYVGDRTVWSDIPEFIITGVDCPDVMGIHDTEVVTTVIKCGWNGSPTIYLNSAAFDIDPSQPMQVSIPEGKRVQLYWLITAKREGLFRLTIPRNPWAGDDWEVCFIKVIDRLWLNAKEARILSLIGIILSSFMLIPGQGIQSIKVDKSLRKEILIFVCTFIPVAIVLMFNLLFILNILSILRAIGLIFMTLLLATIWIVHWYASVWHPDHEIIPTKTKNILIIGCLISLLIFGTIYFFSTLRDLYSIYLTSPIFTTFFIPFTGLLFLYPWLDPSWDQPWEGVSKFQQAMRIFLYVVASPVTVVALLFALSENLRIFF